MVMWPSQSLCTSAGNNAKGKRLALSALLTVCYADDSSERRAQSHDQQRARKRHSEAVAAAELAAYVANVALEDAKKAAAEAAKSAVAKQKAVDLAYALLPLQELCLRIRAPPQPQAHAVVLLTLLRELLVCQCPVRSANSPERMISPCGRAAFQPDGPLVAVALQTSQAASSACCVEPPSCLLSRVTHVCRRELKVQMEERESGYVIADACMTGPERLMNKRAVTFAEIVATAPHQVALL